MPARNTKLSHMLDDPESAEDEILASQILTPDSGIENAQQRKATAGRRKGSAVKKLTAAMPRTRRVSAGTGAITKTTAAKSRKTAAKTTKARQALKERAINVEAEETEEVDESGEEVEEDPPTAAKKRGRPKQAQQDESVVVEVPAKGKRARGSAKEKPVKVKAEKIEAPSVVKKSRTKKEPVVEESIVDDPDLMDLNDGDEEDNLTIRPVVRRAPNARPAAPASVQRPGSASVQRPSSATGYHQRSASVQRQTGPSYRRTGSVSDAESRDPVLRRKLGDMTKKFEALEVKYLNLKEVAMGDTESNFERLKNSTDEREKDQATIIASLRKELLAQKSLSADSNTMRSRLQALESENARLTSETKTLNSSLAAAQNEIKTLTTKLAATRSASAAVQSADTVSGQKAPGSALKGQRTIMVGSAEAAKEAQIKQLKEDLYSDLTGLIVRGVKRGEEEDVYDCIQTGRNGTLHFHLAVADSEGASSYDEVEFTYIPLLDENRDRDLLDLLPDYLTEEIFFPRSSAARFYAKIQDCMTKKIELED